MLRRFIESQLVGARHVASEVLDGLDDRSKLFATELAAEKQRLLSLAVVAFGAVVVAIIAAVWAAATLVAFTWNTDWRNATLLGLLAFWVILAGALCMRAKRLAESSEEAFRFSRQVATDDFDRVREGLR